MKRLEPLRVLTGYDWLRQLRERDAFLRGSGGVLRQHQAYLDPTSALAYTTCRTRWREAAELRAALPIVQLAQHIADEVGRCPLQLLGLGAGDGSTELALALRLLALTGTRPLDLYLIDLSVPLLCLAQERIAALGPPPLRLRLVAGDLRELCLALPPPRARGRRIFTLLGGTLADLEDEARFLRHELSRAVPGDLLVLDVEPAVAPIEQLEEIRAREPLVGADLPPLVADWLVGPLRRARPETHMGCTIELDRHLTLPQSYALSVVATLPVEERPPQRFVLYQFKRYDPGKLVACLERWGWSLRVELAYGAGPGGVLLLCQRRDWPVWRPR